MRGFIVLVLFTTSLSQLKAQAIGTYLDIDNPPTNAIVWKSYDYLSRVWDSKKYLFVDPTGKVVLDLESYSFVGDFNNDLAIVQSKQGRYGVIDKAGALMIDTVWHAVNYAHKYFSLAKPSGDFVIEDRGEGGEQVYPKYHWYIVNNQGQIIENYFSEVTMIGDDALVQTPDGHVLQLNLDRINFGYYHPLMKAIQKIDGESVTFKINSRAKKITYLGESANALSFQLSFQSH